MSELVTKSVAQELQDQETETRTAVKRITGFTLVVPRGGRSPSIWNMC
jgi:hypothetical protein